MTVLSLLWEFLYWQNDIFILRQPQIPPCKLLCFILSFLLIYYAGSSDGFPDIISAMFMSGEWQVCIEPIYTSWSPLLCDCQS